jgi:hypothetical protein
MQCPHAGRRNHPGPIDVLVCDASFIGLRTVLPAGLALCRPGAWAVALIKPQFEAGREAVGAKGVVRDPAVHDAVCAMIQEWSARSAGPCWGRAQPDHRPRGQPRIPDRGAARRRVIPFSVGMC